MKQNLLIINKEQFGYLTDAYYWCKYLRDEYCITFLCFNSGKKKIFMDNIDVKYVPYKGNKTIRGIVFIIISIFYIFRFQGKIIIEYFEHCEILKRVFPWKKMLLDIRTLSVLPDKKEREKKNLALINTCKYFDKIAAISQGIKENINLRNISILPLGADCISNHQKDYTKLQLLYVGTFSGRNIEDTIEGVALFHNKYPNADIFYDIIGFGFHGEEYTYKNLVNNLSLNSIIKFHGKIPHSELKPFLDKDNIGVSYIPITDYYNYQPPTKTFEYALSGLFVIATATHANKEVVNNDNGILIDDTALAFAEALEEIYLRQVTINEDKIRKSLLCFSWNNIVNGTLKPLLAVI